MVCRRERRDRESRGRCDVEQLHDAAAGEHDELLGPGEEPVRERGLRDGCDIGCPVRLLAVDSVGVGAGRCGIRLRADEREQPVVRVDRRQSKPVPRGNVPRR